MYSDRKNYIIEVPVTVSITVPKFDYDSQTFYSHDQYVEDQVRKQIPLYNNHLSIDLDLVDFSDASIVDDI